MRGRRALGAAAAVLLAMVTAGPAEAAGRCGEHPWCDTSLSPDTRAGLLLHALTHSEKVSLLGGDLAAYGPHTGAGVGVPRLDVPTIYYSDGPVGVRQGKATLMPAPIGLAATFDPAAAARFGAVVGNEAKDKGNDVLFAPTINIMRTPLGGRTFEGYGEDPFLVGRTAVGFIRGAQGEGVIADVKHFAANNQEGQGLDLPGSPIGLGLDGDRMLVDAKVDERTLREIYLPGFEAAVKDGNVGTVMCSYNRVNGQFACENEHLLKDVLRRDWGFEGYVIADYGAAHNPIASLNNGLDFEPFPGLAYAPPAIEAALATSLASTDELDAHVRNILRTLFAFGAFDRPAYPVDDGLIDRDAHAATARDIETEAIVMLKNAGGALPLAPGGSVAVIGPAADTIPSGGGSGSVTPFATVTPREAIARRAGAVAYADGSDPDAAAAMAAGADAAVVFVADHETEGVDKACPSLDCDGTQDTLIGKVAAANPHTIVVLETGAPVLTPWRDRVAGILEAWYPGEQGGEAIARVLFGEADPGGRLPATFPRHAGDLPTAGDPEQYPGVLESETYKEGLLVGYRWYDAKGIEPAFPFGFGLSYTGFRYSRMRVRGHTVTARVGNVGDRTGTDVAQLYVAKPAAGEPPEQLEGFERVTLAPGRSATVRMPLDERAFRTWDSAAGAWHVVPGCYRLSLGRSSRELLGHRTLAAGGAACDGGDGRLEVSGSSVRLCPRRVVVPLHLRARRVRRVTVTVNGERRRTRRGHRRRVRVTLPDRRAASRVSVVVRTTGGRRVIRSRRYAPCGV